MRRPTYLYTAFLVFQGLVVLLLNIVEPSGAAVWAGSCSLIAAPFIAVLEHFAEAA